MSSVHCFAAFCACASSCRSRIKRGGRNRTHRRNHCRRRVCAAAIQSGAPLLGEPRAALRCCVARALPRRRGGAALDRLGRPNQARTVLGVHSDAGVCYLHCWSLGERFGHRFSNIWLHWRGCDDVRCAQSLSGDVSVSLIVTHILSRPAFPANAQLLVARSDLLAHLWHRGSRRRRAGSVLCRAWTVADCDLPGRTLLVELLVTY